MLQFGLQIKGTPKKFINFVQSFFADIAYVWPEAMQGLVAVADEPLKTSLAWDPSDQDAGANFPGFLILVMESPEGTYLHFRCDQDGEFFKAQLLTKFKRIFHLLAKVGYDPSFAELTPALLELLESYGIVTHEIMAEAATTLASMHALARAGQTNLPAASDKPPDKKVPSPFNASAQQKLESKLTSRISGICNEYGFWPVCSIGKSQCRVWLVKGENMPARFFGALGMAIMPEKPEPSLAFELGPGGLAMKSFGPFDEKMTTRIAIDVAEILQDSGDLEVSLPKIEKTSAATTDISEVGSRMDSTGAKPKGGRPRDLNDDWAWEQINTHRRPRTEVYAEWLERIGTRANVLADLQDSFDKAVRPGRGKKQEDTE